MQNWFVNSTLFYSEEQLYAKAYPNMNVAWEEKTNLMLLH